MLGRCAMRLSRVQSKQNGLREDRGVPNGQVLRNWIIGKWESAPFRRKKKAVSDNRGGLNRSTQHSPEVLSAGVSTAKFVRER